jgi:hypothetical protein
LLEAIQLVLGSQRNATFSDIDFYNRDVSRKILLQVLPGDLHEVARPRRQAQGESGLRA